MTARNPWRMLPGCAIDVWGALAEQSLPIAHVGTIALTMAFVLGVAILDAGRIADHARQRFGAEYTLAGTAVLLHWTGQSSAGPGPAGCRTRRGGRHPLEEETWTAICGRWRNGTPGWSSRTSWDRVKAAKGTSGEGAVAQSPSAYRVHGGRRWLDGKRKGITEMDYTRLLEDAH